VTTSPAASGSGAAGVPLPVRRRGYVLTAAVMVVMMLGGTLSIPLYVIYQKQMGLGTLGVTVVFVAYVVGTLFALVALGALSDHIGRRKVLRLGGTYGKKYQ
jgi:MFS family permease